MVLFGFPEVASQRDIEGDAPKPIA